MNPVERVIRRVDTAQQKHRVPAFSFGVIKKYGDDNGGTLASNLAHSAFVTVFPLLMILVTVLVAIASGAPSLRHAVLRAVAKQFPFVGETLVGNIHKLQQSSTVSVVVGLLLVTWGATGLAQAGLFTMAQVWNLPGPARPGYVPRLGRAVLFLAVLGVGVVGGTFLTGLVTYGNNHVIAVVLAQGLAALVNIGLYLACFRILTPKGVATRRLVPGAVAGGLAWTALQAAAALVVHHYLHTASVYGLFATVLVLYAWIYLGVQITVYAAEVNVVLTRRLWPRSIVQPPLTEADRTSLALQALQNQRREEQDVAVTFHDRPPGAPAPAQTPQTPEEVTPPGPAQTRPTPAEIAPLAQAQASRAPEEAAPPARSAGGADRPG